LSGDTSIIPPQGEKDQVTFSAAWIKSVTMSFLHGLFALSVSLSFSDPGAKLRRELQMGDKPQWHGVKLQLSSSGFGCVSIGSGMSETMDEAKVARFTAISFGQVDDLPC
jgi:hypothetical protein